jgi:hypothetical protein
MAVRINALAVGSLRIMILHGKQKPLSKDVKRKWSLQFKDAIPENIYAPERLWNLSR